MRAKEPNHGLSYSALSLEHRLNLQFESINPTVAIELAMRLRSKGFKLSPVKLQELAQQVIDTAKQRLRSESFVPLTSINLDRNVAEMLADVLDEVVNAATKTEGLNPVFLPGMPYQVQEAYDL